MSRHCSIRRRSRQQLFGITRFRLMTWHRSGNDAGILIGLGLLCRQSRRPRGSRQHRMFVDIFLLGIVQPHQSLDGFDDPLCIANEIAVGILL